MTTDPIDAALNLLTQQKAEAQRDIYAIDFATRILIALRRDMQSAASPPDSTLPVMDTPVPQSYEEHADYAAAQMPAVHIHIPEPQDIPPPSGIPRSGIISRRGG